MYEPTMGFWENVKAFKDRYLLILFIASSIGLGPSTYKRAKKYYQFQKGLPSLIAEYDSLLNVMDDEHTKTNVYVEVSQAGLRSLMDLKAVGKVKIKDKEHFVEIRTCTMADKEGSNKKATWAFIVNGRMEMYEAVYSVLWEGIGKPYHYTDSEGMIRYVYDVDYDENYKLKFGE